LKTPWLPAVLGGWETVQTQSTLVVVLVAVITTVGFVPVGTATSTQDTEPSTGETVQAVEEAADCVPHPPIRITENQGPDGFILGHEPATGQPIYRPGSGVTAGEGTEEDPYVIEGWCIEDSPISEVTNRYLGIDISGTSAHVVIRDNVITGHDDGGVKLDGDETVTIHNNTITDNRRGGLILSGSSPYVVQDNTLTDNSRYGVVVFGTSDNVVQDNTLTDNDDGVVLFRTSNNVVENNTLTDNDDGVRLSRSGANVVQDNTFTENDVGVALSGSSDNAVRENTITDNGDGVDLFRSSDNAVRDNTITDNGDDGVVLSKSSDNNVVEDNNIQDNTGAGLHAEDISEPVDATDNWWGHDTGPSGGTTDACTDATADGQGDPITTDGADVCFDPWRTSPNPDAGAG
jgi:parallel beta-helix repeat protein